MAGRLRLPFMHRCFDEQPRIDFCLTDSGRLPSQPVGTVDSSGTTTTSLDRYPGFHLDLDRYRVHDRHLPAGCYGCCRPAAATGRSDHSAGQHRPGATDDPDRGHRYRTWFVFRGVSASAVRRAWHTYSVIVPRPGRGDLVRYPDLPRRPGPERYRRVLDRVRQLGLVVCDLRSGANHQYRAGYQGGGTTLVHRSAGDHCHLGLDVPDPRCAGSHQRGQYLDVRRRQAADHHYPVPG